ncbi:glutamyl-tRNA reductase [Glycomyces algeriensis]|uniref:Glutamyl-tRNA reductase n=1 Tax=Glycomyces algeriensis TaxID=256037 RepID=A0A9W6LF38_9ACTN|nr:glutamyl-tRNA reductase [Glycomyces algeriensis]MDA1367650.1 glutamyl-tRNA reductase [Glycomyces algeriensis]MDR7352991.1 glutamyl-tRNA reductase [Glycomyces algeriensis]GLI40680.1 glutamyl-tRNA reductase [Glycomyces algeriensis]
MNLLVVGISHRSAAVETLERLAVGPEAAADLARSLLGGGEVREAVVLSTCNRVEVYATAATFHGGLSAIVDELHRVWGLSDAEAELDFASCGYVRHGADAAAHAFRVAAGLDSMVAGEPQILGQLRDAYETAREADQVGRHLHELFQQALRVGKRIHAETDVDAAAPSVVTAALELAERELARAGFANGLTQARAAVVGAGAMGSLATATLARSGVKSLKVANRDREKAERLAAVWDAETAAYDDLASLAAQVDLLVCATSSPEPVLRAAHLAGRTAPLVVCDLALPKDVAEEVSRLDGVHVVDIAEIQRADAAGAAADTLAEVEALLAEEIAAYNESLRADAVTPTVAALRSAAADIVEAELSRVARRGDFTDDQRAEVARTVHRVVQRLLHEPTVRVRELAGQPGAPDYARALRDLFALDAAAVAEPQSGDLAEALKVNPVLAAEASNTLGTAPQQPGAPSRHRP